MSRLATIFHKNVSAYCLRERKIYEEMRVHVVMYSFLSTSTEVLV